LIPLIYPRNVLIRVPLVLARSKAAGRLGLEEAYTFWTHFSPFNVALESWCSETAAIFLVYALPLCALLTIFFQFLPLPPLPPRNRVRRCTLTSEHIPLPYQHRQFFQTIYTPSPTFSKGLLYAVFFFGDYSESEVKFFTVRPSFCLVAKWDKLGFPTPPFKALPLLDTVAPR